MKMRRSIRTQRVINGPTLDTQGSEELIDDLYGHGPDRRQVKDVAEDMDLGKFPFGWVCVSLTVRDTQPTGQPCVHTSVAQLCTYSNAATGTFCTSLTFTEIVGKLSG